MNVTSKSLDKIFDSYFITVILLWALVLAIDPKELKIDSFVGVVIRSSEIGIIKFEYSKKQDDLQEGDLLELKVGDKRLFYQVVGGVTEKENLDGRN